MVKSRLKLNSYTKRALCKTKRACGIENTNRISYYQKVLNHMRRGHCDQPSSFDNN